MTSHSKRIKHLNPIRGLSVSFQVTSKCAAGFGHVSVDGLLASTQTCGGPFAISQHSYCSGSFLLPAFDGSSHPFGLWCYPASDRECGHGRDRHNRQFDQRPNADTNHHTDAHAHAHTHTNHPTDAHTDTGATSAFRGTSLVARDLGDRRKP